MHCTLARAINLLDGIILNQVKVSRAAEIMGFSRRQVYRLLARYRRDGPRGLRSKKFGRPSPNRLPMATQTAAVAIIQSTYADFGPTLASEKLAERHGIKISVETTRKLMIQNGIWRDRNMRRSRINQLREPCERRGQLVQIDGSHHRWFEDRGPKCALLVFIDDATSEWKILEMAPSETSLAYMATTKRYIQQFGKPVAFYSDKHSIFRNANANLDRSDGSTQFSRVLDRLNIASICADRPQSKGRVERANRTLQDRLVKELRLRNISTIEEANAFLPKFAAAHNAKRAFEPFDPVDAHRPAEPDDVLEDLIRWEESRKVSQALSVQYNKVTFILDDSPAARAAIGQKVIVSQSPGGDVDLLFEGQSLPYRVFDKLRRVHQAEIADSKRLAEALQIATALQAIQPHHSKRNLDAPTRPNQLNSPFPDQVAMTSAPSSSEEDGRLPKRIVSPQLSLQFKNVRYVLVETHASLALIGQKVIVDEKSDGTVEIRCGSTVLPYHAHGSVPPTTANAGAGDRLAHLLGVGSDAGEDRPITLGQLMGDLSASQEAPKTKSGRSRATGKSVPTSTRPRGRPARGEKRLTREQEVDAIIARAKAARDAKASEAQQASSSSDGSENKQFPINQEVVKAVLELMERRASAAQEKKWVNPRISKPWLASRKNRE